MILVTGANGYIGIHLVERLCRAGRMVRALVRRGCPEEESTRLAAMGASVYECDPHEDGELRRALEGVTTVVHLIGSIERPRVGYRRMHADNTRLLLRSFQAAAAATRLPGRSRCQNGYPRIIYLSSIGAAADAGNLYSRTKWEAEEEVRRSGIPFIIIRSSLVIGRETGNRDSKIVRKLARMAAVKRVLPLVLGGRNRVQPIFIGDLVTCICAAIDTPDAGGEIWEAGGPQVLALRDFAGIILRSMDLRRRILPVPYFVAALLGWFARAAGLEGNINLEQIRMSRFDNICAKNDASRICGGRLVSPEDALRMEISRFGAESLLGK